MFYGMANMFPGHFNTSYGFLRAKVKKEKIQDGRQRLF